jgi:DNA-binding protein Fis
MQLRSTQNGALVWERSAGRAFPLTALEFFPGGNSILAGSDNGHLLSIKTSDGSVVWDHETPWKINQIEFNPSGENVVVDDFLIGIHLLDLQGQEIWNHPLGGIDQLGGFSYSPDGSAIAVYVQNKGVALLDADSGKAFWEQADIVDADSVGFSFDGGTVYAGNRNGNLYVLDFLSGKIISNKRQIPRYANNEMIAFRENELVVASDSRSQIFEEKTGVPLALSSRVLEWMGADAAARGEVSADVAVKARWMEELIFSGPLLVIAAASWVSAVFGFPDAALAFQGLLALTYLLWSGFAFGFSHERMYVWENGRIIDKGPLSTAQKIKLSFLGLGFRLGFLLEFFVPGLGLLIGFLLANFLHDFWNTYLAPWLKLPLAMAKKKPAAEESAEKSLPALPQTLSVDELSKRFALLILVLTRGNISAAAERMGVERSTLYRRLSSYGITSETRSISNEERVQIARNALGLGTPGERENFRFLGEGGAEIQDELDDRLERLIIERALTITEGNAAKAADLLQVSRATLSRRMKDFGKTANDFKRTVSINQEWLFHVLLSQKGNLGKSAEQLGISWMEAFVLLAMHGIIGLTPAQRVAQVRRQQLTQVIAQARDERTILELKGKTDEGLKDAAVELRSHMRGHDIQSPEDLGRAVALFSESARRIVEANPSALGALDPAIVAYIGGAPATDRLKPHFC